MGLSKLFQKRSLNDHSSSSQPSTALIPPLPAPSRIRGQRKDRIGTDQPSADEDGIPVSEAAARIHIASIRSEKGLDGPKSNTADLQAALDVYVSDNAE
jgi:hypothetical protein